jgi:hypothetical protein
LAAFFLGDFLLSSPFFFVAFFGDLGADFDDDDSLALASFFSARFFAFSAFCALPSGY